MTEQTAGAAIAGVTTFAINPPGLGTTLRISIAGATEPAVGGEPGATKAIVYTTDADYFFGTTVEAARVGSYGGETAPAIVVGIGYGDETGDLRFVSHRRFLDFYRGPRREFDAGAYGKLQFGGADAFLAALRDHVIPTVESRLAEVDPARRILMGASAGGHFVSYVLARAPQLFHGYSMVSPMLVDPQTPQGGSIPQSAGDDAMVRLIRDLPQGSVPIDTRVFLAAGSTEEDPGSMFGDFAIVSNAYRMRTALARHGVGTEYVVFAGEGHAPRGAIPRALRFLLPPTTPSTDWQAALANTAETDR